MISTRRKFLAAAPLIFVPRLVLAERRRAFYPAPTAAAGGGSCSTLRDQESDTAVDFVYLNGTITDYASKFVAGGSYTICKASMELKKASGVLTGTLKAQIYTDSSGSPGTLVGTASDTIAASTLTGTVTTTTFVNLSAALTSGTTYWAVITSTGEATGEVGVQYAADTASIYIRDGAWSSWLLNNRIQFKLYST